jgi:hypothetical protein
VLNFLQTMSEIQTFKGPNGKYALQEVDPFTIGQEHSVEFLGGIHFPTPEDHTQEVADKVNDLGIEQ